MWLVLCMRLMCLQKSPIKTAHQKRNKQKMKIARKNEVENCAK